MNDTMIVKLVRDEGDQGVLKVLLRMNEELMENRRTFKVMSEAFEALARVQTMLNGVADGLSDKMNKLEKRDDDPRSTREMIIDG